ncbi:hypothetical protein D3C71_1096950 [compost metagenome]
MGQPFDADLVVLGLHCLRCLAIERDERCVVDAGLHQRFGKLHAGARIGAVGIDHVACDAKALALAQVVVGRLYGACAGQREALLVGGQRLTVVLLFGECRTEHCKRIGTGLRRARHQITVDRRKRAFAVGRTIVLGNARGTRQRDPQIAVVGEERQGTLVIIDRRIDPAGKQLGLRHGFQVFNTVTLLVVAERQPVLLLASLLQDLVRQEGKPRRGTDIWLDSHFDDLARNGAGKSIELAVVGFEKAPLGFDIVREGTALVVADTGSLALILADILHGP